MRTLALVAAIVSALSGCSPRPRAGTEPRASVASSAPAPSPVGSSRTTSAAAVTAPEGSPALEPQRDAGAPLAATPPASAGAMFAFSAGSPRDLFAHDNDALARWIQQEHSPGWGVHADVTAGAADEWLTDVFQYAFVLSTEANGFYFRDFGKGDVEGISAVPLTRKDKKDVVVRYWVNEGEVPSGYRHLVMEVWSFGPEGPRLRFAAELSAQAMCCGSEANAPPRTSTTVSFHDGAIDLTAERSWRVDARFRPGAVGPLVPPSTEVRPMLPAGVKRRTWAWDGAAFVLAREEKSS